MSSTLSLVTAASETRLTTVAAVREHLCLGAETDTQLDRLIVGASALIASHIGMRRAGAGPASLGVETVAERFGPMATQSPLVLSRFPPRAIISIAEDGVDTPSQIDSGGGVMIANPAFAYAFDQASGVVWKYDGSARAGFAATDILATYEAGWVLPADAANRTLPYDIEDACILLVRRKIDQFREGDNPRIKQESFPGIGSVTYAIEDVTWANGMPSDVAAMLKRWRRFTV